jgi:transposase
VSEPRAERSEALVDRSEATAAGERELSWPGFGGVPDARIWSSSKEALVGRRRKYPPELLERAARVVIESGRPIAQVGRDLGIAPETLRRYVRQVEANEGLRPDLPTAAEREEIKRLRRENFELRRANEILKAASVFFATELDADRPK